MNFKISTKHKLILKIFGFTHLKLGLKNELIDISI